MGSKVFRHDGTVDEHETYRRRVLDRLFRKRNRLLMIGDERPLTAVEARALREVRWTIHAWDTVEVRRCQEETKRSNDQIHAALDRILLRLDGDDASAKSRFDAAMKLIKDEPIAAAAYEEVLAVLARHGLDGDDRTASHVIFAVMRYLEHRVVEAASGG